MAVTLTEAELAEALAVNHALADRLHAVAMALVERYAPEAPEAIQNEAVIRCAGWLSETRAAPLRKLDLGGFSLEYSGPLQSALRHSGAMSLLSPWKVRRAGAI